MPDIPSADIAKNARETVRVAIREFKGSRNIDLRVYAQNGKEELTPTAKGISVKPTLLRPVIEALQEAARVAEAEGLMR